MTTCLVAGLVWGLWGVAGCGDSVRIITVPADGAAGSGGGGTPNDSGTPEAGAGGATVDAGGVPDVGSVPETGSVPDASSVPEAGVDAAVEAGGACQLDRDCPRPPTLCAVARCSHGACTTANAKAGTVIPDMPGDCHDVICDGAGGVASRPLDEDDVPVFDNPCLVGTCNKAGMPGVAMRPARTPCHISGADRKVCDGNGLCVECLEQSDCPPGLHCSDPFLPHVCL
jgi:hypothetical protein